jgi:hypothetical protein
MGNNVDKWFAVATELVDSGYPETPRYFVRWVKRELGDQKWNLTDCSLSKKVEARSAAG